MQACVHDTGCACVGFLAAAADLMPDIGLLMDSPADPEAVDKAGASPAPSTCGSSRLRLVMPAVLSAYQCSTHLQSLAAMRSSQACGCTQHGLPCEACAAERVALRKGEGVHVVPSVELALGLREAGPPASQRGRLGYSTPSFGGGDRFGGRREVRLRLVCADLVALLMQKRS